MRDNIGSLIVLMGIVAICCGFFMISVIHGVFAAGVSLIVCGVVIEFGASAGKNGDGGTT